MIGGGRPLLRENLADTDPPPFKMPIFARHTSAITVNGKKVLLALIGSSLRTFQ